MRICLLATRPPLQGILELLGTKDPAVSKTTIPDVRSTTLCWGYQWISSNNGCHQYCRIRTSAGPSINTRHHIKGAGPSKYHLSTNRYFQQLFQTDDPEFLTRVHGRAAENIWKSSHSFDRDSTDDTRALYQVRNVLPLFYIGHNILNSSFLIRSRKSAATIWAYSLP